MSLKRMKCYIRTSRWEWYASVACKRSEIKDYVESLKWNEEQELSYEIKDYVEFLKWNELKVLPYELRITLFYMT